jgi:cobalt/nickel transport system ATP-binding protein
LAGCKKNRRLVMIKIDQLSVRYHDGNQVINQLDMQIADGETVGVIGANGAGKSTLLMSLVGILSPSEGSIEIDGVILDKNKLREIREKVGVIFQNPDDQLFMNNVYDDIAFGLRNYGMKEENIHLKITGIMEELGVEKLQHMNSHKLSGGEKRIIAIATILVMEPSVILFDEPSSFLDPKTRRRLIGLLRSLKVTKLIATHDLDMALELCDRIIVLKEGRIFTQGSAKEILTNQELLEEAGLELPFCLQRPLTHH